jgi:hypothetical protein
LADKRRIISRRGTVLVKEVVHEAYDGVEGKWLGDAKDLRKELPGVASSGRLTNGSSCEAFGRMSPVRSWPSEELPMTENVKNSCHQPGSFVLRIWWEGNDQPIWRGWVQHAASGETRYFLQLADLLAFVEAHTGRLIAEDGAAAAGNLTAPER